MPQNNEYVEEVKRLIRKGYSNLQGWEIIQMKFDDLPSSKRAYFPIYRWKMIRAGENVRPCKSNNQFEEMFPPRKKGRPKAVDAFSIDTKKPKKGGKNGKGTA